jgi:ABC-2 type transport system ATP-binding protein
MPPAIRMEGVGKRYWKLEERAMLLRSLVPFRKPHREELWALRGLDVNIEQGEVIGVIGRNGAGKTTMLRMLAGVTRPSEGRVSVSGRVAPLISVGVGFHREMSGRENVYVNGMLLGLTKKQIDERFDQIVGFAELADFIDTPVKFYSSGMFMRLGFSVAVHTDPQVLLVDEVLAVGDLAFQLKCLDRMKEIREAGTTIVMVSHSMPAVRLLCPRALVITRGQLAFDGDVEDAIAHHHQILSTEGAGDAAVGDQQVTGGAEVLERELLGPGGPTYYVRREDDLRLRLRVRVRFTAAVANPVFVFLIRSEDASVAYGMQTPLQLAHRSFAAGEETEVEFSFAPNLAGGTYRLTEEIQSADARSILHSDPRGLTFQVEHRLWSLGIADLGGTIAIDGKDTVEDRDFGLTAVAPGAPSGSTAVDEPTVDATPETPAPALDSPTNTDSTTSSEAAELDRPAPSETVGPPAGEPRSRPDADGQRWWNFSPSVWALLGLAGVLRVVCALANRGMALVDDPADYHRLAVSLANGHGFGETVLAAGGGPTAFRPPLYPLFLGAVYKVTGDSMGAALVAQAFLGVVTAGLLGVIGWQLWGRRAGLMALGVGAVYPPLILAGGSLLTESISLPLQLAALAAALEQRRTGRHRLRWAAAAGVATGLAVLARPPNGVLLVPVVLLLCARPLLARRNVGPVLIAGGLAVLTVLPWTIRNTAAFDRTVLVSTSNSFVLGGVYNRTADEDTVHPAMWRPPTGVPALAPLFSDPSLDEAELAERLDTAGRRYARDHPGYVARVVFWNGARLFDVTGRQDTLEAAQPLGYGQRAADVWLIGYAVAALLAVAGLAAGALRRTPLAFWATPLLFIAVTIPTLGTSRYRAPIEPFIVLLAAFALTHLLLRRPGALRNE